ncbi:MAG: endolytic transglycosylase MltG [Pseudohongiellaceae bacterium]
MTLLLLLKSKRVKLALSTLILLLGSSAFLYWSALKILHTPLAIPDRGFEFEVPKGSSLHQLSRKLQANNIFEYPQLLVLYARIQGDSDAIKQGKYLLEQGETANDLLLKVVAGKTIQYRVTLVEGWTFSQALTAIQASENITVQLSGLSSAEIAEKAGIPYENPEGALFPDTYFYSAGSTDTEIIKRASEKLQLVLAQHWEQRLGALPYDTPYQALVMASIIEKESAASSERGKIAGVFVRRLEQGMRLQSDPTVIYGMGDEYDGDIRSKDLRTTTAYNTYRINGLPPTPIALAGNESLMASLNPESGNELYFVSQGDGTHYFSSNLQEHNAAVKRLINGISSEN